jgi:hypothetical protein
MTSRPLLGGLAAGALLLASGAVAQTPYGQTQPSGQDVFAQILQNLFGGQTTTSIDAEWSRGRRPLGAQQAQFRTRLDAQIRSGALSSYSADRLRADYEALVQLEARYAQDGRFTI